MWAAGLQSLLGSLELALAKNQTKPNQTQNKPKPKPSPFQVSDINQKWWALMLPPQANVLCLLKAIVHHDKYPTAMGCSNGTVHLPHGLTGSGWGVVWSAVLKA